MSKDKDRGKQLAIVGPPQPDGSTPVTRMREGDDGETEYTTGHLVPAEDGKAIPMGAELISLSPCEGTPFHEVEVVHSMEGSETKWSKGPSKVASDAYREGWENIFGRKPRPEDMN